MEDEGVLFEGLRLGSVQAFEDLLRADDATMRRLGRLYVPEDRLGALVRQTWEVALPGLDMFTWHTTLRAWLTGILVTYGRAWRTSTAAPAPRTPDAPGRTDPRAAAVRGHGPDALPWASLGWSSLWREDSWGVLEDALAARPLGEQEVLWLHDVEGWSWREVLDTLGLTGEQGADLLLRGREALAGTVAAHVGADPVSTHPVSTHPVGTHPIGGAPVGTDPVGTDPVGTDPVGAAPVGDPQERLEGVAHLLAALRPVHAEWSADPRLVRAFTAWRRQRGVRAWRRWRWELGRTRPPGRAGATTG